MNESYGRIIAFLCWIDTNYRAKTRASFLYLFLMSSRTLRKLVKRAHSLYVYIQTSCQTLVVGDMIITFCFLFSQYQFRILDFRVISRFCYEVANERKLPKDTMPRILEDEGFYIQRKPKIHKKTCNKMENRLLTVEEASTPATKLHHSFRACDVCFQRNILLLCFLNIFDRGRVGLKKVEKLCHYRHPSDNRGISG